MQDEGRARTSGRELGQTAAKALLAAVVSARASSFLFSKLLLAQLGPFTLMGIRFLAAFALLALVFRGRLAGLSRATRLRGLALGGLLFVVMACELHALTLTQTSTVSFLENTAVVLVPLGEALLLRRLPSRRDALGALLALAGVGCLTLAGGPTTLGPGEALAAVAAVAYAAALIAGDRFSKQDDPLALGILQVGWIGALGMVAAVLTERPTLPAGPAEWAYLAVLVVVCSGFGFTLQPVAQRPLSSETTSLMCALNPLVAAVLGVAVLGERLGATGVAGLCLILAAIAVASLPAPANGPGSQDGQEALAPRSLSAESGCPSAPSRSRGERP